MPDQGTAPNKSYVRTDGTRTGGTTWQDARDASVKIRADAHDTHDSDVATALNNRLMLDGGNKPSDDINWGGNGITNFRAAAARGEPARINEIQDGGPIWGGTAGGTADALTIGVTPALTTQVAGQTFLFIAASDNTGSATLNPDSRGAKTIKKGGTTDLEAGDIKSGRLYAVTDDGTNYQLHQLIALPARTDVANVFTQDQNIRADETLLKLRRTADDTSADRAAQFERGDGSGTAGYIDAVGDGANGVDALKLGAGDTDVLEVNVDYITNAKQAYTPTATLTDQATIAWNLEDEQYAKVTLGGNRTLGAPTSMKDGGWYTLRIIQDATGSRTLSYNAVFKFPDGQAPTLSTGAGDVDVLVCTSDGTSMFCAMRNDLS